MRDENRDKNRTRETPDGKKATAPEFLRRMYAHPCAVRSLRVLNVVAVLAVALAAGTGLALLLSRGEYRTALSVLLITGVPFALVTLLRRILHAPRPYDLYGFCDTPPKKRASGSFPSRHVFSAFSVGTLFCFFSLPAGISLLLLGVLIALCRVFLGIHFPRDVVAGALIGVLSSVIGCIIFF